MTEKKDTSTNSGLIVDVVEADSWTSYETSRWARFKDSFQRQDPNDVQMDKAISKRHLRLIAMSTGLGTGLLVAAGDKLRTAGPLFLLIAYAIVGYLMLVPTMYSVSELSVAYNEISGGFNGYYRKFMDESMAFALGWNYCIQWMTVISLELVTAAMTIKFWNTSINPDVWVVIFLVVVVLINLCGARGYGEAEFVMNSCKVLMLSGFVIFGIIIDVGGGPNGFVGGKYWREPGAYTNFKGLCTVFVTSAFSLGGTEFISLSAAEQTNPQQAIPAACKLVFYRITILFMGSLAMVGLLVPYTSDRLMGSGGDATHASPYVIAAEMHGVKVLPHIINAVILVSVTSVATAGMYSSTRLLQSLAEQGYAPKYLDYIDKSGRPLRCWLVTVASSIFSFIATYHKEETVFNWLLSISALSFIFVWLSISVCHLRFRAALKYNNIPLESLAYVSPTGIIGSWVSVIINSLILVCQFWVALFPAGASKPDANSFFQNYLGAIVLLVFYIGHKLWTRNWKLYIKVQDINIDEDRTIPDHDILEIEALEANQRYKMAPWWKKMLIVLFD
ncbi:amino acid transporter [Meyerozyma guilliermondii]